MAEATIPLSIVFALQGIAAALGGKWALDVSVASWCPCTMHCKVFSLLRYRSTGDDCATG